MSSFVLLALLVQVLVFNISEASLCSELDLTSSNPINDDFYSIVTEQLKSPNIIKISLVVKQDISDTSWFLMGATDSFKLIGSWQPFTSVDGQLIDCSLSPEDQEEQAVSNENSMSENPNRSLFTFYWMAPPSFSKIVTFVATISNSNTTDGNSSSRSIQSIPMQIEQTQGRERYQDVNISKLFYDNISFFKTIF
jgi:hypothetical protein